MTDEQKVAKATEILELLFGEHIDAASVPVSAISDMLQILDGLRCSLIRAHQEEGGVIGDLYGAAK